ncbi:PREDICTED: uncharacterized protein LOC109166110 [Ipomoea nil]|uniref:uncharacterized protein LOC109166110 n=1 Tax=Ipomoea nil TaxID=35883 RepID=UPI000901D67E|nr:PREDICTED: uncharacterized protein LOC109166110 [Ipomoea nil]
MASQFTITTNDVIQLNAPSNFPIKLTPTNFPVWKLQVQSTLIGFNLLSYIDDSIKEPTKFSGAEQTTSNPAHLTWYRQDQIITNALLGSCSDTIQPLISSAPTASDAWQRLVASYASASRGQIISLKAKLTKNPKGDRLVTAFLTNMRSTPDDLALAQSPVSDDDMVVYVLTQLGDEYRPIVSVVHVHDTPISLGELANVLTTDHKRHLKEPEEVRQSLLATANATERSFWASPNSHQPTTNRRFRSNSNTNRQTRQQNGNVVFVDHFS